MSDAAHLPVAPAMPRHLRLLALGTGTLAALLGLITSAGWLLGIRALVQIRPSFAPMLPSAAVCFLMTGFALLALAKGKNLGSRGCGVVLAALVTLTVIAQLTNPGLKIGPLASGTRFVDPDDPTEPMRMAPNTATAFLLVGLALALAGRRGGEPAAFAGGGASGIAALSLSTVALVGYALGIEPAFGWGRMLPMAPQTAVGLAIVGFAIVAVVGRPDLAPEHSRKRWLAFLVGVAGATTTLLLWQALAAEQERALQTLLDAETLSVRSALTSSLQLDLEALVRLARRWEDRVRPDRAQWEKDAGDYIKDFPVYLAIAWADPQGTVRWVVPLTGNERILGIDFTADARRRAAVDAARRINGARIYGPLELLLGGRGFGVLVPLSPQGGMGGFITAGFRGTHFLDSVLSTQWLSNHHISLLLAGEPLGLASPGSPLSRELRSLNTWSFLGQQWSLEVTPTTSWADRQRSALPQTALGGGLLFSGLLAWSVLSTGAARSMNDRLLREGAERRVAERERDKFFSLSIDMLCISNTDGYFKRLNPAFEKTLGYTVEELTGRPFLDFIHPDDVAPTLAEVEKQFAGGVPTMHFENRYRCKDDSYRWLAWTSMPDLESGMMYALARDVTLRKGLEAEQERLILELRSTLAQVRTLSELLPMCSGCRRIKDDADDSWNQLELYLSKKNSGTQVSHDMCPECMQKLYPDYSWRRAARERGEGS
jgi:PAS domain S-box-containing protein